MNMFLYYFLSFLLGMLVAVVLTLFVVPLFPTPQLQVLAALFLGGFCVTIAVMALARYRK